MRSLFRATLLIAVVLAVPVLPLLLVGATYEGRVEDWLKNDLSAPVRCYGLIRSLAARGSIELTTDDRLARFRQPSCLDDEVDVDGPQNDHPGACQESVSLAADTADSMPGAR